MDKIDEDTLANWYSSFGGMERHALPQTRRSDQREEVADGKYTLACAFDDDWCGSLRGIMPIWMLPNAVQCGYVAKRWNAFCNAGFVC